MSAVSGPTLKSVLSALGGTDTTLCYQDTDLLYRWVENLPVGWFHDDIVGKSDTDVFLPAKADILISAKRTVLQTGEKTRVIASAEAEGGVRWYENFIEADLDENDNICGLLLFVVDITEKVKREESLHKLLLEVSHRSRNLLSVVQSIAKQSLLSGEHIDELGRFNERIQSLALTLDVVTADEWDGASLHELVEKQIEPFTNGERPPQISGLNPKLTPNAAVHIGLALGELAAHSRCYGASGLSADNIELSATAEGKDDNSFVFKWCETTEHALGSNVGDDMNRLTLERVVPVSLGGDAELTHSNGRLIYKLRVPAENFS